MSRDVSRRAVLAGAAAAATGLATTGIGGIASAKDAARSGPSDIVMMDALDLSEAIARRKVSCVEVMQSYLAHIRRVNPAVNAIISLASEDVLVAQAKERDQQLQRGEYLGWMHGFPHAVKELAAAKGFSHTQGSPIFKDRIADSDALHIARIKAAGAIVIGKTNAPEFGLGSQTYNPIFGTTGSAYDPSKTSGGSSGGAASALALRMVPVADGGDYMGSLRNPAAFNNCLGFRPSWGRIPANSFIAQLGVSGPMGRKVKDVAALLSVMAGPTKSAPLDIKESPSIFRRPLERDFRGVRLAFVGDYKGYLATEPGVLDLCRASFATFESLGARVDEVVPDYPMNELFVTFMNWRGLANIGLKRYYDDPATRDLLKPEAQWEIERGAKLTAVDIDKASKDRDKWYATVVKLFETYDYILAPTAQVFPFDKSIHHPAEINGRKMDTYHRWMETVAPWSLTDLPVMGMPVGFGANGLPMGIQLIGKDNDDFGVIQMAHAYEQASGWVDKRLPPLLRG